ncbi:MAG: YggT family protein [Anaerolineae bacterium]
MILILEKVVSGVIFLYQFLIFVRVLLTWVNPDPYRPTIDHPLIRLLQRVTDPVLAPLRRIIPPIGGTVDISPIVALVILEILRRILSSLLLGLAS